MPEACPPHSSADIVANMAASTVAEYLAALPADRRAALSAVRKVINENLPDGYEEGMQFAMIGWYVPLSLYPAGYGENPKVHSAFQRFSFQRFSVSAFQRFSVSKGHMANYQAARALLGKGNSAVTRVKERPGFQKGSRAGE